MALMNVTPAKAGVITIKAEWEAAWYYLCIGGSGTICTVTIEIDTKLTTQEAEDILGITLPSGSSPLILKSGEGSPSNGDSLDIESHSYVPDDPRIIEGEIDNPIDIPSQTVVYSSVWEGFIGYYFESINP